MMLTNRQVFAVGISFTNGVQEMFFSRFSKVRYHGLGLVHWDSFLDFDFEHVLLVERRNIEIWTKSIWLAEETEEELEPWQQPKEHREPDTDIERDTTFTILAHRVSYVRVIYLDPGEALDIIPEG